MKLRLVIIPGSERLEKASHKYLSKKKNKSGKWIYDYGPTSSSRKYKAGQVITIDMGSGKETVTVGKGFKAGQSAVTFITLERKVGAPYTITTGKLDKIISKKAPTKAKKKYVGDPNIPSVKQAMDKYNTAAAVMDIHRGSRYANYKIGIEAIATGMIRGKKTTDETISHLYRQFKENQSRFSDSEKKAFSAAFLVAAARKQEAEGISVPAVKKTIKRKPAGSKPKKVNSKK